MLNFTGTSTAPTAASGITDPARTSQAPEWQVIQRGGKGNTKKKKDKNKGGRGGMGEKSSQAPSLCDILDSPEPKKGVTGKEEDINGQVIIRRGSGTSMSMDIGEDSMAGDASMSIVKEGEEEGNGKKGSSRSGHKRKREECEGECLELRLRIEELESLIKNGRGEWEEARKEAVRAKKETEELFAGYERLKFTYFDSLYEAVKVDVSPKGVRFKRRRATKAQWGNLGAGVGQSAVDLFAEATFEGIEPSDYPSWISNKLSTTMPAATATTKKMEGGK